MLSGNTPVLVGITSWGNGYVCQSDPQTGPILSGDLRTGAVCNFIQQTTCIGVCVSVCLCID